MNFIKNGDFRHFFASYFITRAEFDSLKNNFQSQIDQYNSSVDSKIDGAIAAYLVGIKLTTKTIGTFLVKPGDSTIGDIISVNKGTLNKDKQYFNYFYLNTNKINGSLGYYPNRNNIGKENTANFRLIPIEQTNDPLTEPSGTGYIINKDKDLVVTKKFDSCYVNLVGGGALDRRK